MNPDDVVEIPLDELRGPTSDTVFPPASQSPDLLPFDQRSPTDFERMCLVIAERVEGLHGVRLYGVPGQRQHGIDLVGLDDANKTHAWQVKRYRTFSERDLREAIAKYAEGNLPFKAETLVICVSSLAEDTNIIDTLQKAREDHDFEIDLYDQRRLSEMLRSRHDLITRLFTAGWAEVFAIGGPAQPTPRPRSDLLAETILRGPFRTLGVDRLLEAAEGLADTSPALAASKFGEAATALENIGLRGFADRLSQRQAELRSDAGDPTGAASILSAVGWRHIADGRPDGTQEPTGRLRALAAKAGLQQAAALAEVMSWIAAWHASPRLPLDGLESHLKSLVDADDPHAARVALWLGETAIAVGDSATLSRWQSTFRLFAAQHASGDEELSVRLLMCVADGDGEWAGLVRRVRRGELPRRLAAWVLSRHARWLAWTAKPEEATDEYRSAIEAAFGASLAGEASKLLTSLWRTEVSYNGLSSEVFVLGRLVSDVEDAGATILNRRNEAYDVGMVDLANKQLPSALRWLHASLRDAAVTGNLEDEVRAHAAVGDVLAGTGEIAAAVFHLAAAGESQKLAAILPQREFIPVDWALSRPTPWLRASAWAAVAAQADLVPDAVLAEVTAAALLDTQPSRQGWFGPQVDLEAWRVLAALADRLPDSVASDALDRLATVVERQANTHYPNDDEHIAIAVGVFANNATLRAGAGDRIVALLSQDDILAGRVVRALRKTFRQSHLGDELVPALTELANSGNRHAVDLLYTLGQAHPALIELASERVKAELGRPPRVPGHFDIGTQLAQAGYLARALPSDMRERFAEHLMVLAEDATDAEMNRIDALYALLNLSAELPLPVRALFLDRCVRLATNPAALSPIDQQLASSSHPLSAFRIHVTVGLLPFAALRTAAGLAGDDAERQIEVAELGARLLFEAPNEQAANDLAWALLPLPRPAHVDPRTLTTQPYVSFRQLAVVWWCQQPDSDSALGQTLVGDADPIVRRTLAEQLGELASHVPELAAELAIRLAADVSFSVRHAVPQLAE